MRLLLEQEPGIQAMGEAATAAGLIGQAEAACPEVVLDLELPGQEAPGLLAALRSRCPSVGVIALSGRLQAREAALAAGADAFVSKSDPPERVVMAVKKGGKRGDWGMNRLGHFRVRGTAPTTRREIR